MSLLELIGSAGSKARKEQEGVCRFKKPENQCTAMGAENEAGLCSLLTCLMKTEFNFHGQLPTL